ncbi:hypothetical protein TWF694_008239 [Orbilia ellipsospora]|uniref:Ankyrin repeat protein n=1 Tax=Orbilia ellipsospora TaxID=2528407 RepID=A0AAV9XFX6_9PEZI
MSEKPRQLTHDDYTVGWICALSDTELVAATAMLDHDHPMLPTSDSQDMNCYFFGSIGDHNVVIACLPEETTGKVSAAIVAKDMIRSFKSIRFGLLVGVGGGAPYYSGAYGDDLEAEKLENSDSEEETFEDIRDIRLGDVVISLQSKSTEAVVQYDFGKSVQGKEFIHAGGKLNKPPNIVLSAVAKIKAEHKRKNHKIPELLSKMRSENPLMDKFRYPGLAKDLLFKSNILHVDERRSCKVGCGPLDVNLVKRKDRGDNAPRLHYGTIGSADQVMKDAILRDKWAEKEKIMCFEMEAAGLIDSFPCIVIRGICDYADSHKSKIWQPYAAATAAAYAKELLLVIPGQGIMNLPPIALATSKIIQQLGTWRKSDEEEKCLQAFRTTIYESQKNSNPDREDETCLWCLNDKRFLNWRDRSTSCLLWITADPGCGKSVLSKALVDERLLDSTPNDTTICYFFFKDTSEEQRSLVSALAALLHQLFKSKAGQKTIKHALPAFRENKDNISRNIHIMWSIVESIALDPDCGKIVFLLDALDECQSTEQKDFIKKLKLFEIQQIHHRTARNFKFFITSRPYWKIENEFESLISDIPRIRLKAEKQSESLRLEIDRVIRAQVSRLDGRIASRKARERLVEELRKVENRTYLWLHLIFELIAPNPRIDTETVTNLFQKLPKTIEEAYDAILKQSGNPKLAKRLLHIVVAAVRPLSVFETSVALYMKEDTRTYKDLEIQELKQLEANIRHICGLFVTIVNGEVLLVHQTAKEFLIVPNDLLSFARVSETWRHSLHPRESNRILAETCVWRLTAEITWTRGYHEDLWRYSVRNWVVHFREAGIQSEEKIAALAQSLCETGSIQYMAWSAEYTRYPSDVYFPKSASPLIIASYFGLDAVVRLLLEKDGVDINSEDEYGRTPLSWAASGGYDLVVKLLLANDRIDINSEDEFGWTPLSLAVRNRHEAVAKLLLEKNGVDTTSRSYSNQVSLSLDAVYVLKDAWRINKVLRSLVMSYSWTRPMAELQLNEISDRIWWKEGEATEEWLVRTNFTDLLLKSVKIRLKGRYWDKQEEELVLQLTCFAVNGSFVTLQDIRSRIRRLFLAARGRYRNVLVSNILPNADVDETGEFYLTGDVMLSEVKHGSLKSF